MLNHLIELRRRIIFVMVFFLSLFLVFFYLAPDLFHQLVSPLLQVLPTPEPLIATQMTTPLFIPIKLAADAALVCTAPFALLQIWYFALPGLYQQERKGLRWAVLGTLSLFCAGVLFCFYIVLPYMLRFFAHSVPNGVRLMPDITYAVDFITHMLLIFGLGFQVPLLCLLMVYLQVMEVTTLKIIRPYVIVAAFTIGMLITPPDVFSQIMVAVPLCILYELGIFLTYLIRPRKHFLT